jgi:HK97 family phage major capsid protein
MQRISTVVSAHVDIDQLRATRNQLAARLERQLKSRDGNSRLTKQETRAMDELKRLGDRIRFAESEQRRSGMLPGGQAAELSARIASNSEGNKMSSFSTVYRKGSRTSYVSDLVNATFNRDDTGTCRRRLEAHREEVQHGMAYQEHRDLSRVDGAGGYFVPPAWLIDEWVEFARPGRAFANLLQAHPLPGGTDSINVPKILTGTQTAIQVADNTQVQETDLTDTFINSPVRTIAGQQSVALQLIDQSPIAFDDVILQDLTGAYAVNLDQQTLYGSGTSGQILGVTNTPGIGTIAVGGDGIQAVYSAIANAIQTILTTRFRPPTHIVVHPRRWAQWLSLLDNQNRPLFVPYTNAPFNAAGVQTAVEAEGPVGTVLGLTVVADANVTTTAGNESGGGDEDVVYVLRAPDVVLYESGVRSRVLPGPLANTLSVLVQLYSYVAIATRFPSSIVEITGFTPPTF